MDVYPLLLRHNLDVICYLSYSFVGELRYLNESRITLNLANDILSFIYPLYRFASVLKYMMHAIRLGQRHYVA